MGCCNRKKSKGVKSRVIYTKSKSIISYNGNRGVVSQKSILISPSMRTIKKRTCPKCGWPMSHNIQSYDSKTKKAIQLWSCTNKRKCKHRIIK